MYGISYTASVGRGILNIGKIQLTNILNHVLKKTYEIARMNARAKFDVVDLSVIYVWSYQAKANDRRQK